MTVGGWILMILSWVLIITLVVFCFSRVIGQGDGEAEK